MSDGPRDEPERVPREVFVDRIAEEMASSGDPSVDRRAMAEFIADHVL